MHRVVQENLELVLARLSGPSALAGSTSRQSAGDAFTHLEKCQECREELAVVQAHSDALHSLGTPPEVEFEPRAGFYARVMERIEAEGPVSIWNLFMESPFGRRIAVASLSLALLLGVYVITAERSIDPDITAANSQIQAAPGNMDAIAVLGAISSATSSDGQMLAQPVNLQQNDAVAAGEFRAGQDVFEPSTDDGILSNLVTYREQ